LCKRLDEPRILWMWSCKETSIRDLAEDRTPIVKHVAYYVYGLSRLIEVLHVNRLLVYSSDDQLAARGPQTAPGVF
jgi:hypothetical protein